MRVDPLQVGLERVQEPLELRLEGVLVAQEDPVRALELVRHGLRIDVTPEDGDQALIGLDRAAELVTADRRGDRLRGQDEDERACRLDAVGDALPPVGRRRYVLEIEPNRLSPGRQRRQQPRFDEGLVAPRVGDEQVRAVGMGVRAGTVNR